MAKSEASIPQERRKVERRSSKSVFMWRASVLCLLVMIAASSITNNVRNLFVFDRVEQTLDTLKQETTEIRKEYVEWKTYRPDQDLQYETIRKLEAEIKAEIKAAKDRMDRWERKFER